MSSVLQKFIQTGAKVGEIAAPIVGGAIGGPAGAAAGATLSRGIKKISQARQLGGPGFQAGPTSASSIGQARAQDKSRMKEQYGLTQDSLSTEE